MASLIPNVSITEFKKLKPEQLKALKSCEVTSNGSYLFTFVNAKTGYIKNSVENLAQLSNAVGGKTIAEVVEENAPVSA